MIELIVNIRSCTYKFSYSFTYFAHCTAYFCLCHEVFPTKCCHLVNASRNVSQLPLRSCQTTASGCRYPAHT